MADHGRPWQTKPFWYPRCYQHLWCIFCTQNQIAYQIRLLDLFAFLPLSSTALVQILYLPSFVGARIQCPWLVRWRNDICFLSFWSPWPPIPLIALPSAQCAVSSTAQVEQEKKPGAKLNNKIQQPEKDTCSGGVNLPGLLAHLKLLLRHALQFLLHHPPPPEKPNHLL